jgi:hypothetical protein
VGADKGHINAPALAGTFGPELATKPACVGLSNVFHHLWSELVIG